MVQPLICREESANTHQLLQQAIATSGCDMSTAISGSLRVGSRELMKEAIAAGLGTGFITSGEVGLDSHLHCLDIEGVDATCTDYLLYRINDRYRKVVMVMVCV